MQIEYVSQETNIGSNELKWCNIGYFYQKLNLFLEKSDKIKKDGQHNT